MEKKNWFSGSNKIKIIVISMIIFATSIIGITYAYFGLDVIGNETASSVKLRTAKKNLVYNDVQIASGTDTFPGWTVTKTLTVENTGRSTVAYNIIWRELVNSISNNELVIRATCTSSIQGNTCDDIPETPITYAPETITDDLIFWTIDIDSGETHTYTITIEFKDTGSNQDYNQRKSITGTINIGDWAETAESCFTTTGEYGGDSTKNSITGYDISCGTDVVIPRTIDGKPVIKVGDNSMKELGLTSVVIAKGVQVIGINTFKSNDITSVKLPPSLTSIMNNSFEDNEITSLVLPEGIQAIGNYAFKTNQIASVDIPDTVTTIGAYAFNNNNIAHLNLGTGVQTISQDAFHNNELTTVVIPSSVVTIGNAAFRLNHFSHVDIPSNVMSLGNYAFGNGNVVESVTIHGKSSTSDFTTYGTNPFNWATGITCTTNNTSNVTNGCITWMGPGA